MVSMKFVRCIARAAALFAAAIVPLSNAPHANAQSEHHRHENSVNRQFRLARAIEDTYSHQWEVAAGGGFLRFEPGPQLRRDNQIDWSTSAAYYFTPAYSIVGDIRGHFGDVKLNNPTCSGTSPNIICTPSLGGVHPLVTEYTFMAGPQWRFYRKEKYAISAHVMGGDAMGNFDGGSHGIPSTQLGMWPDNNHALAASVGANLDYNFYPNFGFRVQPTYVYTRFGGANQNNKGVNFEFLYRFGRQK